MRLWRWPFRFVTALEAVRNVRVGGSNPLFSTISKVRFALSQRRDALRLFFWGRVFILFFFRRTVRFSCRDVPTQ